MVPEMMLVLDISRNTDYHAQNVALLRVTYNKKSNDSYFIASLRNMKDNHDLECLQIERGNT